jgi:hypothetical protein
MVYFIGDKTFYKLIMSSQYCKRMVKCKGWLTAKTSEC